MKTILVSLSAASLMLLGSSCRIYVPVDPNTGEPGCNMMPEKTTACCTEDCTPCSCKSKGVVEASK